MWATTAAPSPMLPPTRFTESERTSPIAKTAGTLDSSAAENRLSLEAHAPDNAAERFDPLQRHVEKHHRKIANSRRHCTRVL
jgi:hypothetical protein